MLNVVKQYKNLILLVIGVILIVTLIASDPLGYCARRSYERAAIRNQMAIERAETEYQIAVIEAKRNAVIKRIENGLESPQ